MEQGAIHKGMNLLSEGANAFIYEKPTPPTTSSANGSHSWEEKSLLLDLSSFEKEAKTSYSEFLFFEVYQFTLSLFMARLLLNAHTYTS